MNPRITLNAIALFVVSLAWSIPAFSQGCPTHQALLDKMDEIFEAKEVDRLGEVYHTDAVVHNPEGTTEGLDAIIAANKKFFADIPDAKGENLDVFCSGDKMAVRWKGTGTMNGKKVNVTGITIYHVRDGKLAEVWEAMDMMNIMSQLGYELKPPPGTESENR
jgi:predicted ester cyclase